MRLIFPFCLLAATALADNVPGSSSSPSVGDQIVRSLLPAGDGLKVGVGNWLYQDSGEQAPVSVFLRDQVEASVGRTTNAVLFGHEGYQDLQLNRKFRGVFPLDPGGKTMPVKLADVQALIRGRYFVQDGSLRIQAELYRLDTAQVTATAEFQAGMGGFDSLPTEPTPFIPFAFQQSQASLKDVAEHLASPRHDFAILFSETECQRFLVQGERVSYRFWPAEACHVAVFDHEPNGSTVLLFPNAYETNTYVPSHIATEIPVYAPGGFCFRIGRPFGADVIQIIACTEDSELHQAMAEAAAATPLAIAMPEISRTELAEKWKRSLKSGKWSETQLLLNTIPKPAPAEIKMP